MQRINSNKLVLFKVVFYFSPYCRRTAEQSELEYHEYTTLKDLDDTDAYIMEYASCNTAVKSGINTNVIYPQVAKAIVCVQLKFIIPAHFERFAPSIYQYRCMTSSLLLHFA